MTREILVNVNPREMRAAVVENGVTLELFIERASRSGIVGMSSPMRHSEHQTSISSRPSRTTGRNAEA